MLFVHRKVTILTPLMGATVARSALCLIAPEWSVLPKRAGPAAVVTWTRLRLASVPTGSTSTRKGRFVIPGCDSTAAGASEMLHADIDPGHGDSGNFFRRS